MPFTLTSSLTLPRNGRPARWLAAVFSWGTLGAVLVAVMLARWVWVFAAPAEVSVPATISWTKNRAAENLFGQPVEVDASALATSSSYKLIGVFAHPKAGFAVLLVDGKQVGAGLGSEVSPGLRLVETGATFVLLERGGVRQRVELQATNAAGSGITPVSSGAKPASPQLPAPEVYEENDELAKIPPEQREVMQQELENFRRRK